MVDDGNVVKRVHVIQRSKWELYESVVIPIREYGSET